MAVETSSALLLADGITWIVAGVAWYAFPRRLVANLLHRPSRVEHRASDDDDVEHMTRGFGVALAHAGAFEVYASARNWSGGDVDLLRFAALSRLVVVGVLVVGWVAFHRDSFHLRPGFWGSLASLALPLAACVASRA